jgi:hypothetical protein
LIAAFFIHKDNLIKDLDTGYREPLKSRAEKGRWLTGIFVRYTWAASGEMDEGVIGRRLFR